MCFCFCDSMFVSLRPGLGFLRLLIFGFSGSRFRVAFWFYFFGIFFAFVFFSSVPRVSVFVVGFK